MDLYANVKYAVSNSRYKDAETVTCPEVFYKKDLLKNLATIFNNICERLLYRKMREEVWYLSLI